MTGINHKPALNADDIQIIVHQAKILRGQIIAHHFRQLGKLLARIPGTLLSAPNAARPLH